MSKEEARDFMEFCKEAREIYKKWLTQEIYTDGDFMNKLAEISYRTILKSK